MDPRIMHPKIPSSIPQAVTLPSTPRPIMSIGAGGIVRDAQYPAYRLAGFPVAAVYDPAKDRATALARDFAVPHVASSFEDLVAYAPPDGVFDVAVPAAAVAGVLDQLPDGAVVLIQKPMGENLQEARRIRDVCRRKSLIAAINFQLRFAPNIVGARSLIASGALGEVCDVEIRVTCHMPWEKWPFLRGIPRTEIIYHSIHYVDLVRSLLGEPAGVHCKTVKHPNHPDLASTRTTIAFDYGEMRRATITTNHGHVFGPRHQESYLKVEGTRGAAVARLGVNLDYPRGMPDTLEFSVLEGDAPSEWAEVPLVGNWFPHAFVGPMASLTRRANGETTDLPTSVEDAYKTMAVVEACYDSSARGAQSIPQ